MFLDVLCLPAPERSMVLAWLGGGAPAATPSVAPAVAADAQRSSGGRCLLLSFLILKLCLERALAVAGIVLLIGIGASARAGDLPNTPPDGWWWYYGQTPAQIGSLLNANNARLISLHVEQASPPLFTVTMVRNTGAYAKTWWWFFGQTEADIGDQARTLNARVINLDVYESGGQTLFAAILISNTGADASSWWWYSGQSPANISALLTANKARLLDFRQYSVGGGITYAAVMVGNTGANAVSWWWYFNVSPSQVSSAIQQNGAYLTSLQIADPTGPTFNVIMNKLPTPTGNGWWWYFGVNAAELASLYDLNNAWLRDVKTYQLNGQRVFTAVMLGNAPPAPEAVVTYHYDNNRTGWNSHERTLNPSNVATSNFGLRQTVAVDDQVDAQPLVIPALTTVGGHATDGHDVAYIATESNTVYAIDAANGTVLVQRNLSTPVPTPLNCNNNGPNVGINGTPVIDPDAKTMYVVTYGLENGAPVHRIHALDITTLADRIPSVVVTATHTLSNGSATAFQSRYQRQRPGLLAANGNIYVAFGSFCDFSANISRGWILGWKQNTLAPLPANQLTNQLVAAPNDFFLSSIWMSGYGLATDSSGYIYAVTGNSDPKGTTYSSTRNIAESVVKISPDLTKLVDLFTPSNVSSLDQGDTDFGSGGVMVVPEQGGPVPHLLAAAGKDGRMFLLNADNLGGFTPGGPDKVVTQQGIGDCWCGESYFMQPGGVIVSSGGASVALWTIQTWPNVSLNNAGSSPALGGAAQDGGHFTTVSSAGAGPGVIIWAVSRPESVSNTTVFLYAFSEEKNNVNQLTTLSKLAAGTWPNTGGNANLVPVVANGRVFVASYKHLSIFGLQ
jgi:hypothetical protein